MTTMTSWISDVAGTDPVWAPAKPAARPAGRPAPLHARSRRVAAAVGVVAVLSLADLALTMGFMATTGMYEDNPLVVWLVRATGSVLSIAVWKLVTCGFACGVLLRYRARRSSEIAAWSAVAMLLVVAVRWAAYAEAARTCDPTLQEGEAWVRLG
jgi:hypothetical protein